MGIGKHEVKKKEKLCLNIWLKGRQWRSALPLLVYVLQTEYSNHSLVEIHLTWKIQLLLMKILFCFLRNSSQQNIKEINLIQTYFWISTLWLAMLALSQLWIVFPLTDVSSEQTLCVGTAAALIPFVLPSPCNLNACQCSSPLCAFFIQRIISP